MKLTRQNSTYGYTIVELMVTIVIVAVLTATLGGFIVKLLTIQEQEREDAYVREKLSDICGRYADFISLGTSITNDLVHHATAVKYRWETGGVSLETGLVTRAAYLVASLDVTNRTMGLDVEAFEEKELRHKVSRRLSGDAPLLPILGDVVSYSITPINAQKLEEAALFYLEVTARYEVENDEGIVEPKTVSAGRMVRLWNRE